LAHISGKTDRTFTSILSYMYLLTRKSQLSFGSHLEADQNCGSKPDVAWAAVCSLQVLCFSRGPGLSAINVLLVWVNDLFSIN